MPTSPGVRHVVAGVVVVAALATVAVPTLVGAATPKPNGFYSSSSNKDDEDVVIILEGGKITGGRSEVLFTKHGKTCRFAGGKGPVPTLFASAGGVTPSAKGAFSFKASSTYREGVAAVSVRGRFTSSKRATVSIKGTYGSCKGSYKTTKAKLR